MEKEKKILEILAMIIKLSHIDNIVITTNKKKLKENKESKRDIIACPLSSLSKSTISHLIIVFSPTITFFLTTNPFLISTSFFFIIS